MSEALDTVRLEVFARAAAAEHGRPDAQLTLLNVSENATYRLDDGDTRFVIRVHRTNYHTREAIESELMWIEALRTDEIVQTAPIRATPDGRSVIAVAHPDGEERFVVAFEWLTGVEPPEERPIRSCARGHAVGKLARRRPRCERHRFRRLRIQLVSLRSRLFALVHRALPCGAGVDRFVDQWLPDGGRPVCGRNR